MKISYIIPVYNSEKYLKNCVESIIECNDSDWEIILVDDGSTDASGKICDELSCIDKRINVFHLNNGGVSKARNFALKKASGEYIRFIDSDDLMVEEGLKITLDTAADLITMNAEVVDENDTKLHSVDVKENKTCSVYEMLECMNENNKPTYMHYLWNHLYKKSIIEDNNICFDESVNLGEDFLFNIEYIKHCKSIEFRRVCCYRYFKRNNNSLTLKFHEDELERRRKMDNALINLYREYNLYDSKKNELNICIGSITIGALESVCTKKCNLDLIEKIRFISGFLESEYYDYLTDYIIHSRRKTPELFFIQHKMSCAFYLYVKIKLKLR